MKTENHPLILQPTVLNEIIPDSKLLIIAVVQSAVFNTHHIPGSVLVEPWELVSGIKPAVGKLPDSGRLSALFSRIGLSDERQVIVYDDEGGGWAGRLIWTLDILGQQNYSYLDGGLTAWLKSGFPLSANNDSIVASTNYTAQVDESQLLSLQDVITQIPDSNSVVWDARAAEEYQGLKITALRNGHIPGAVNLNWLDLQDKDNDLRLKPLSVISSQLENLGISKDKNIITHCQTHHRSGLTYLVGKALGYNIKAYDGSWSEWGNHADTPIQN